MKAPIPTTNIVAVNCSIESQAPATASALATLDSQGVQLVDWQSSSSSLVLVQLPAQAANMLCWAEVLLSPLDPLLLQTQLSGQLFTRAGLSNTAILSDYISPAPVSLGGSVSSIYGTKKIFAKIVFLIINLILF